MSASARINKMEKWELKAARIALGVKKDTPSICVKEMLNYKTLNNKLDEQLVKL